MNGFLSLMCRLAPILATLAFIHALPAEPAKPCSVSPWGTLYAINGVIIPSMTEAQMRDSLRGRTFLHDTLCLDPQDSTFNRRKYGQWVISGWTQDGPGPHVLLALDRIRYEQDRHFKRHGTYITSAAEVILPLGMDRVHVTLRGDEHGWIATTTIRRLMQTCTMFDGRVLATGPATEPRKVACAFDERS